MLNKIIDKPLHLKYATCLLHLLLTETYKYSGTTIFDEFYQVNRI